MRDKMRLSVTMTDSDFRSLKEKLFTEDECENFAVLFCGVANGPSWRRLLVRELWFAPDSAYQERLPYHLRIAPGFFNTIIDHSLTSRLSPVIVHSHPKSDIASYSLSDDFGESRLLPVLEQLLPGLWPSSLLITTANLTGRRYVSGLFVPMERVDVKGRESIIYNNLHDNATRKRQNEIFDRQIKAIGIDGQSIVNTLKVGVVGLGGTGSAVAEQLVRVGVRDFVLVDPDLFEASNLSRIWGSRKKDLKNKVKKTDIITRNLREICKDVVIKGISDSVVRQSVLQELRDRDIVFGCTDNHLSRAILNKLAHQYLIPVVDMGIRMDARSGCVTAAGGRATLVGSGMACLRCSNHIDAEQIRVESLPPKERNSLAREGYIQGLKDPAPNVISLNTTVAGLATTMGINLFVNLTGQPPQTDQIYDATNGIIFTAGVRHEDSCDICSPSIGLKGLGDLQPVSAYE